MENSIYNFKPIAIEGMKLRGTKYKKENSIGFSESKIFLDATIPFQSLGIWRNEELRREG